MRTEDGYIIHKCLNGEVEAFGLLVDKYKESIYALAYSKVHNFHDAEDITQEAFIKAFQKLRTLRWWDNFMAWIYTITSNLCKDWMRARSRRPDREFVEDQIPSLSYSSMESYRENRVYESLHEALDSLPEIYSQVLVLHYLSGMKVREMARFLGTSTSTIARRLRKARTQLKGEMLTMMRTTFDEQTLQVGFTFRIVEMIKRTAIQPTSRISRLSLGLSAAAAIILTFLTFSPRLLPIHRVFAMMGSSSASKTEVTYGIPVHLVKFPKPAEQAIPVESLPMTPNLDAPAVMKTLTVVPTALQEITKTVIMHSLNPALDAQSESILPEPTAHDISETASPGNRIPAVSMIASGAATIGKSVVGEIAGTATKTQDLSMIKNADVKDTTADVSGVNAKLIRRIGMGNINSIAWSPDGEFIAVGTATGIHLVSSRTRDTYDFAGGQCSNVSTVAFSPDGSMIASGGRGNIIKLWAASSGECVATLRGHRGGINSVAFSPDGSLMASASDDETIKLWSMSDGKCIATLKGHKKDVKSVAFSPDSSMVVSGGGDSSVKLWRISTGECVNTLKGHIDKVGSVAFSPDGSTIASGCENHSIKLWRVSDGQCTNTLGSNAKNSVAYSPDGLTVAFCAGEIIRLWTPSGKERIKTLGSHHGIVNCIAFSPDGSMMASGGDDKTIKLRDLSRKADDNLIATLMRHQYRNISVPSSLLAIDKEVTDFPSQEGMREGVTSIAFSPDGSLIASGSVDNTVKLWTVSDGECIAILEGHRNDVRSVVFSPDGLLIASKSDDNTVRLWRVSDGKCAATLAGPATSIAFSPDGSLLALGSASKPVRLWSVKDQEYIATIGKRSSSVAFSPDGSMIAAGGKLWSVPDGEYISGFGGGRYTTFSPDGSMIAFISPRSSGNIKLWSVLADAHFATLKTDERWIQALAFSPDGTMITSGSGSLPVKLWRLSDGDCIATMRHGWWSATSLAFSPNGSMVASGSRDGTIKLWKTPKDEGTIAIRGHRGGVNSAALSPDSSIIASGGTDGMIKLWDTWDGKCVATLLAHDDGVNSVAFSPDGSIIASGGGDRIIKLWSALDGEIMAALKGHDGGVNSVAFSPDGSMIASASDDRAIRLWNMSDGECVAILKGHRDIGWSGVRGSVLSVAFSPDSSTLASGSDDKTVRLWSVSDKKCIAVLKGHRGYVHSVAFNPDGSLVASGSEDKAVKLWRVSDGECISTLEKSKGSIGSVAFSSDGSIIVYGNDDGSISLWSVSDGGLTSLEGHSGKVHSIVFSRDGAAIVSGSEDGTIGLWEIEKL